jgi:tetratricopeptide (TPR) repeat protein
MCFSALVAISQDPNVQRYSEAGQRALAAGNYAEAEQAYERLRDLEPRIAEVHANLGLIYFEEGEFDQAIAELQRALKLKPSLTKTEALLAMSLSEVNRYSEALPGLEKAFRLSSDPEMKRMSGMQLERVYTASQRDDKAVEIALELNRLYPDDPEILYHDGKIFGNFAFLTMQKLVQVAPASVWRHQAAAEAHESEGAYVPALAEYERVLALEPNRRGIHYRIGRTLLARSRDGTSPSDVADAAKEFEQELRLDPTNASAAYELGEINRKAAQLDQAQKYFDLALKNYPDFEEAHVGLAATLIMLQKPKLALPHLQKAIALNSEDEAAWYRLLQVDRTLGTVAEQQKALGEFRRLREKSKQQNGLEPLPSPNEVTKQEVDPNATP